MQPCLLLQAAGCPSREAATDDTPQPQVPQHIGAITSQPHRCGGPTTRCPQTSRRAVLHGKPSTSASMQVLWDTLGKTGQVCVAGHVCTAIAARQSCRMMFESSVAEATSPPKRMSQNCVTGTPHQRLDCLSPCILASLFRCNPVVLLAVVLVPACPAHSDQRGPKGGHTYK